MGLRVLVCGDRHWTDREAIRQDMVRLPEGSVVIQGECRGADLIAKSIAIELGLEVECYPAEWDKYGKAAGPIRNTQMLKEGKPNIVLAYHDHLERSSGTKNMIKQAEDASIAVEIRGSMTERLRTGDI